MDLPIHSLINQAVERFQKGDLTTAETLLKKALQIAPHNFAALHVMGIVYVLQAKYENAVDLLKQAVEVNPDNSLAHYNLAIALSSDGKDAESLLHHAQAVKLAPSNSDAWVNYGKSLSSLKRYDEALDCYAKALEANPEHIGALGNQGALLAELGRNEEALSSFEKVQEIDASHPAVWLNLGNTLRKLKRYEEALDHYDRAIKLDPGYADTWSNKANVLCNLNRHDEALKHYDQAIKLEPENADAWYNKGYTLASLKRHDEALPHFERAIELDPHNPDTWFVKANTLNELKRYKEAIAHFDRAMQINPDREFLFGDRLSAMMSICDWDGVEAQFVELAGKIQAGKKASTPFTVLSVLDAPSVHRQTAESYVKNFPADHSLGAVFKPPVRDKIRLAYFTKDFHEHATAFLTAGLFELHDKDRFEVFAFSFGPEKFDKMRVRLMKAFDQFVDLRGKTDKEIAQCSREMGIDIAVDLQGFQTEHRPGIFASRAAPIQVNYLAYPGTMGAEYMNYLIADKTLIPPGNEKFFSEKIVYLPNTYQPNDRKRTNSDRQFTRQELGLPKTGFVFCCFNNNYKITPQTFDGWMRILKQVDGSVLWLLEDNPIAVANLRKEAVNRGVSADRLIFAKFMNQADHLARHRAADLFIDTLPYNAHTTASDALWAGLPVLTLCGESFPSRVAASLLNAIDMPELVTQSQEDFENLAVELATHPEKLAEIKKKLAKNRLTTPLFDTPRYTRDLEAAYINMFERYQSNLPPDHIVVE
jgi:protein O-GlcNAc transferase